ncbi:MAG: restriction endonuclease [Verrucomicrobia bacterium CG22_combo_CG10-13_8_21_14_all_43_17]|nr:MAG: restriction endonuclease [Verrucomicrobia bacterium CG1_02_43_26]PIP59506.1 MAG: restriction endonuclease [Verrucomicrobia bacterium CG22_combo_CG10-13_8_21_14_all_43_17]
MSDEVKKNEILQKAKSWFKEVIIEAHIKNTKILSNPKQFKINPFLVNYLARFFTGDCSPESIARVLIYPRMLSTSINTSFGQNLQNFISKVLNAFGSVISGIDIEFEDQVDGRKKFCQVKLGPNTINKDDVKTINDHFHSIRNLAKTNRFELGSNDLIVGVLYGGKDQLSTHYKNIEKKHFYPVYVGEAFWQRLTGDNAFYQKLISAFNEIKLDVDSLRLIEETVQELAKSAEIIRLAEQVSEKTHILDEDAYL